MDIQPPGTTPTGQPATPPLSSSNNTGDTNKVWAIVGYILPILFFIPLLGDDKMKPAVRFHANQQLLLLIFWIVTGAVLPLIPVIGWMLMPVAYIIGFAFMVMGIINASQNQMKPLPVMGKFVLIK